MQKYSNTTTDTLVRKCRWGKIGGESRGDHCMQKDWGWTVKSWRTGPRAHLVTTPSSTNQARPQVQSGAQCGKCGPERQSQETQPQRHRRDGPPCPSSHLGRCPGENQPHRIPCISRTSAAYDNSGVIITAVISHYRRTARLTVCFVPIQQKL